MFKALRRWWKYLGAKVNSAFNAKADPKIQLEQAITEAQDQHRRLREQAANVIANQKQTEMRLDRAMEELEKVSGNAKQAVLMADEAAKKGDAAKVEEFTAAAESFANRLIAIEKEVEDLKALALQSSQASDQAKAAVQQNATALQRKLAERNKLLSQLDQAKMQEQVNKAMASLSETVGEDVPTFDEVREKIEARYAKAKGMSELTESSVESRMLEVEQAAANSEAQTRLAQIRAQLGLAPAASRTGSRRGGSAAAEPRRRARGRPRRAAAEALAALRQHHEVVPVDDLVGHALGQLGGVAPGHLPQAHRAEAHEALGEHPAVEAGDLHGVVDLEGALHRVHPGGEQRHAAVEQRSAGAVVDDDRAVRARPRTRSTACGPAGAWPSGAPPCPRPARRPPPPPARRRATPGRSPPARPTTRRSWRPPASTPCRRCPGRCRCRRRATRASGRPRRSPRSARPTRRAGDRR